MEAVMVEAKGLWSGDGWGKGAMEVMWCLWHVIGGSIFLWEAKCHSKEALGIRLCWNELIQWECLMHKYWNSSSWLAVMAWKLYISWGYEEFVLEISHIRWIMVSECGLHCAWNEQDLTTELRKLVMFCVKRIIVS